jgi:carboxyl-terminal processing protease
VFGIVIVLLVLSGCNTASTSQDNPQNLIWESWEIIDELHVDSNNLDKDRIVGGAINAMLSVALEPSYPFLKELGSSNVITPVNVPKDLKDLWQTFSLIIERYPDIDQEELAEASLYGIMNSIGDPYGGYINPKGFIQFQNATDSYEGIGVVFGMRENKIVVLSPMEGGPGERAGLLPGDIVIEVDGNKVDGKSLEEATSTIRGERGSRVTFLIERPGEASQIEISITRALIDVSTVDMSLLPSSIGYIYIERFHKNTFEELVVHLETLNELETLGLILDLRGNPGSISGSLSIATDVASEFMEEGLFLYSLDNKGTRADFVLQGGGSLTDGMELVVLVNEGTSKDAEALAYGLQRLGRAVVVGDSTLGVGGIYTYHKLSNGGALYIPTSTWFASDGTSVGPAGINPDIEIPLNREELSQGKDSQVMEAYRFLDRKLPAYR